MTKPAFWICKNKDADHLCGNPEDRFSHNEAQIMVAKDIVSLQY